MTGRRRLPEADRSVRWVVVLVPEVPVRPAPPGIEARQWARALFEDTYELALSLTGVGVRLAGSADALALVRDLAWPGTGEVVLDPNRPVAGLSSLPEAVATVLLPPDVPDVPGLLVGKLFRELGRAPVALCPARDGGLAGLGVAMPVAPWLTGAAISLDSDPAAVSAAAPGPREVRQIPGWHRIRTPADLVHLDPGLEGWDATRALVSTTPRS